MVFGSPVGAALSTWRFFTSVMVSQKRRFILLTEKEKQTLGLCIKAQDKSILSLKYDCRITRPFVSQETVVFVVGSWGVWMDSHAFHSHFLYR